MQIMCIRHLMNYILIQFHKVVCILCGMYYYCLHIGAFQVALVVKNLSANAGV